MSNNETKKPIEKFDEVYNKGKGRIEIMIPISKIYRWIIKNKFTE